LRVEQNESESDEAWQARAASAVEEVRRRLASAAGREPAITGLARLRAWRPFELSVMQPEDDESLRPLT
jgi:hypothetical protein